MASFQSSLELSPECNRIQSGESKTQLEFQSSLELSPECNQSPRGRVKEVARGFNPHSSFRPSATLR